MLLLCPQTVLPCSPIEVIDAAVDAGFDGVDMRVAKMLPSDVDVMAEPAVQKAILARLAETKIKVVGVEVVRLTPDIDVPAILPMLKFIQEMGARSLTVTALDKAAWQPEHEIEVARKLGELAELAGRHGVRPMIEFMAFRGISTLQHALRVRELAGHANIGLCVDALHFHRSGGKAEELSAIDGDLISVFHLCDAPPEAPQDLVNEARNGRMYPGTGGLPLRDMLKALPRDTPVSVETPDATQFDRPVLERARRAAQLSRDLLASVGRS